MSPERDEPTEDQEQEIYEDVPPRSIFAATWFRVVLVVIVLGVIGAVAVPYVLDWMNPPPPPRSASSRPAAPLPPSVFDKPAADKPAADRPFGDKPVVDKPVAEKKDPIPSARAESKPSASSTTSSSMTSSSSLTPKSAATAAPRPAEESKPEPKATSEPKATPAPKPAPEPKVTAKAPPPAPKPADSTAKVAATTTDSTASTAKSAASTPKSEPKPAAATKPPTPKPAAAKATPVAPAASGPFWVQVGAFKDAEAAKKLATKLRDENFKVEESVKAAAMPKSTPAAPATAAPAASSTPAGADQYDVFISGMSVEELNRRLAGKGLAAETSAGGVVVKPSLPLRDAVTLSKDLAVEGFKVQVKRAPGTGPTTTPPSAASGPAAPAAGESGPQLHRVRVGAFADRAAAQAAAKELEAKGYKPYIARGDQ